MIVDELPAALRARVPAGVVLTFPQQGMALRRLHTTNVPHDLRTSRSWLDRKLEKARENLAWCDGSADEVAAFFDGYGSLLDGAALRWFAQLDEFF